MWQRRDELCPTTNPVDWVNSVSNSEGRTTVNRFVTGIQKKLLWFDFPGLTGSVFDKLKDFQRVYGVELKKLAANELLLHARAMSPPPDGGLKGLALLRKNEQISNLFRSKGNDFYEVRDIKSALRCYTLAASYAPPGSAAQKLSYSNRSACCAYLCNWTKCLEAIELFEKVDSGVVAPALLERIEARKTKCLERVAAFAKIETKTDEDARQAKEFLPTLKNESKLIPGAEDFVGIRMDAEKGRCLYNKGATRIESGTLIILDKAYFHAAWGTLCFEGKNCNACFKELRGGGIPCPTCVFHLYCSETCKASDFAKTHSKYECKVLPYLHELKSDKSTLMHMDVSILLQLGPQGLLKYLRRPKEPENHIPGLDSEGVYDPTSFETVANLSWNEQILHKTSINDVCNFALLATNIVDEATDYFSSLKETEPDLDLVWVKDEFTMLLVRLKLITQMHNEDISRMSETPGYITAQGIRTRFSISFLGYGLFPVVSLLNQSCVSNVVQFSLTDKIKAVTTTKHVDPGEEFCTDIKAFDPGQVYGIE